MINVYNKTLENVDHFSYLRSHFTLKLDINDKILDNL